MKFSPSLLLATFTSVLALFLWWVFASRSSLPDPTATETLLQSLLDGSDEKEISKPSAITVPASPEAGRSADPQVKVALLSQSPPRSISLQTELVAVVLLGR